MSLWLSDYRSQKICFNCAGCKMRRRYDVDSMLNAAGDIKVSSLPDMVAKAEGCKLVPNIQAPRCMLALDPVTPFIRVGVPGSIARPLNKPEGLTRVTNIGLKDIRDSYELYVLCPCEHTAIVDRIELKRQVGGVLYLQNISKQLVCTACGNTENNEFAVRPMPR